jgi:hypothetical protein
VITSIEKARLDHYTAIRQIFMREFNFEIYAIGGTLLGLVRDGRLLPGDKDADFAYFSNFQNVNDVRAEYLEILSRLVEIGAIKRKNIWLKELNRYRRGFFNYGRPFGTKIDIMVSWHDGERYHRPTFVSYVDDNLILPLRKIAYEGYEILMPNRAEEHLAHVYGSSWRVPDPHFSKIKMRQKSSPWLDPLRADREIDSIFRSKKD